MADAGYTSQHPLSIAFYYTSGDPIGQDVATILKSELSKINVSLTLTPVESSTFDFQSLQGIYPMFYDGWVNLLANPDDGMRPLFDNQTLGLGNTIFYNNSTVSSELITAGSTFNSTLSGQLYTQVQKTLADQAVEVPLFNLENVIPTTNNIKDLYIYPTFDIFIAQAQMT